MIDSEKIKKLILGSADDRALANEYIKEHNIDVIPEELTESVWKNNYYRTDTGDLYHKSHDNTWFKIETVFTTSTTTTKI